MRNQQQNRRKLIEQLRRDEGAVTNGSGRHIPYRCSAGKLTIGYGHNLEAAPLAGVTGHSAIPEEAALRILEADLRAVEERLAREFPWSLSLDYPRFAVLCNMAFTLGVTGLSSFTHTLAAVKRGDYQEAAHRMLASRWATQVKGRARRLAKQMETGTWQ